MSGDLRESGSGTVPTGAGVWWTDTGLLVDGSPEQVRGLLESASDYGARLVAAVYRASAHIRSNAGPGVRRQLLALDAARFGEPELSERINRVVCDVPAARWSVSWATGSGVDHRLRRVLTGHDGGVLALDTLVVEDRPLLVTTGRDRTARVWDLLTGEQISTPLTGHADWVEAVEAVVTDERPLIVTGSRDGTVRVWDLATHEQVGLPLVGHTGAVHAVATTVLDGRTLVASGGEDGTIRLWDIVTREQVAGPLRDRDRPGPVRALATVTVDGRPIVISGGHGKDGNTVFWDLSIGRRAGWALGADLPDWATRAGANRVLAVAASVIDGRPVAVTGNQYAELETWDLATGVEVGDALSDSDSVVRSVTTGTVDGRVLALAGSPGGAVAMWDLAGRKQMGKPLTGHTGTVHALAITEVDGTTVALSGSDDGTVRMYDLTAQGAAVGAPVTGHTGMVREVAVSMVDGRALAMATNAYGYPEDDSDEDYDWRAWDLATGQQVVVPADPHQAEATAKVDGRAITVTVGEQGAAEVRDTVSGNKIGWLPVTQVRAVATTVLDGCPLAVTGGDDGVVRAWDLTTWQQAEPDLVFPAPVRALATGPKRELVVGFGADVAVLTLR
ncbi:WD40 repeat domain-containing protein [Streptomyces poriticola]|uniref:WD40 repeat domain-containing protein n=1 Tax=Streptomyces poriticola TaxID=3120506 RepID=UPI002FCDF2A2